MRAVLLVMACLASVGRACKVPFPSSREQYVATQHGHACKVLVPSSKEQDVATQLARLLLASNPAAAFAPSSSGMHFTAHSPVRANAKTLTSADKQYKLDASDFANLVATQRSRDVWMTDVERAPVWIVGGAALGLLALFFFGTYSGLASSLQGSGLMKTLSANGFLQRRQWRLAATKLGNQHQCQYQNNPPNWVYDLGAVPLLHDPAVSGSVPPAPQAPSLEPVDAVGSLRVRWAAARELGGPSATFYTVHVREVGQSTWMLFDSSTGMLVGSGGKAVPASSTECVISGLSMGKEYKARVAACNDFGWGAAAVSLPGAWSKPQKPSPPDISSSGPDSVRVKWEPLTCNPPVIAYTIRIREVGGFRGSKRRLFFFDADSQMFVQECEIPGLKKGYSYEASLQAKNAVGWSPVSSACGWPKPPRPASPTLSRSESRSIQITWEPVKCVPPVTGYTIKVRKVGSRAWKLFDASSKTLVHKGAQAVSALATECKVTDLDGHYEVSICAENQVGWSDDSTPTAVQVRAVYYQALLHGGVEYGTDVNRLAQELGYDSTYKVVSRPSATMKEALADVRHLVNVAHPDDVVVYAFSGHGYYDNSRGIHTLRFKDGKLETTVLADELRKVRSRKMVVIIDSCFAGKFPGVATRANGDGQGNATHYEDLRARERSCARAPLGPQGDLVRMMHERSGKLVIMAGEEEVPADVFWDALLSKIAKARAGNRDLYCFELFSYIAREVQKYNELCSYIVPEVQKWNESYQLQSFQPLICADYANDFPVFAARRSRLQLHSISLCSKLYSQILRIRSSVSRKIPKA